ncbi:general amino acid permease 1 [Cantharellus anzutake]|uniref:general amino acid permease 1 n=1 Tax=Cantharellus anzutake TaxID=1750568 RepID=UPI0019040EED|nr:general amino acid permease 1 [Cantharellus anzutake]KAF8324365.1 general amino acid permease 1 [Cantharellus anzutake]
MSHIDEKSYPLDKEKGADEVYVTGNPVASNKYHFDEHDLDGVQRRLGQRHVQMIAIAGTIGTGLFLGSGKAIERAGPLGALLAYLFIGSISYSTLCSLGEMTSFAPISGSFPHFAARWVDPAFGFATGWNYFYTQAISVPVEVSAAQIILTFWDPNTKHFSAYITVISLCVILVNLFGVRWFGESEFVFSIIKLSLITGLIIAGLIIDLGGGPDHDRIGFRYWKHPGAMNTYLEPGGLGRFLAILGTLVQAAFSYQGVELVAIAASETRSPRRNIRKAVRRVFYRIIIFYVLGILITGMIVPFDDKNLLSDVGNAAESPYVIAIRRAGIRGLPHVINACVFTSAFSAGNSFLYTSSRILYGLALRGQAPRFFAHTTSRGLPLYAVLASGCFPFLAFLTVSNGANTVFNWFVNLSTVGGFFAWLAINSTYIGFWRGLRAQGIDRTKFVYWSPFQPYLAIWGTFWLSILILINGFAVFWSFNASDFLTSYINVPLAVILFVGYKWPEEMDFVTGIPSLSETEEEEIPPKNLGEKIAAVLF